MSRGDVVNEPKDMAVDALLQDDTCCENPPIINYKKISNIFCDFFLVIVIIHLNKYICFNHL